MSETSLKEFIQPYPGINDFIFFPTATGEFRTWIYRAMEDPQTIMNFHFMALMTQGWNVKDSSASIVAERNGSGISVSTLRRENETRIIYEIRATGA